MLDAFAIRKNKADIQSDVIFECDSVEVMEQLMSIQNKSTSGKRKFFSKPNDNRSE